MHRGRKLTLPYVFFYLLFSPATWQVLIGGLVTLVAAPHIINPGLGIAGQVVLSLMLLTCAAWIAAFPAGKIALFLRKRLTSHL